MIQHFTLIRSLFLTILLISIVNIHAQYCNTSYILGTDWAFINGVELNNLSNIGSGDLGTTYCDFTDMSASLTTGHTYLLRIHNNDMAASGDNMFVGAWIDYNLNNEFEVEENIAQVQYDQSGQILEIAFTVPPMDATTTRLRVRQALEPSMLTPDVAPCDGDYMCGETEDYTVIIENQDTPIQSSIESSTTCDSYILQAYPISTTLTYAWYFEGQLLDATTSSIEVTETGSYMVEVSFDTNTSQTTFTLSPALLELNVTTDGEPIICLENGDYITLNAPEGFETYTWTWEGELFPEDLQNSPTLSMNRAGTYYLQVTNADGCTYNTEFFVAVGEEDYCHSIATGIEEHTSSSDIDIFPNPATDHITVALKDFSLPTQASLFDVHGKLIHQQAIIQTSTISLENFTQGIYFLKVEQEGHSIIEKVMIR